MRSPKLYIIIPILNESHILNAIINNLIAVNDTSTILFIDGGSSDNSVELLEKSGMKVLSTSHKGRGPQISMGLKKLPQECDYVLLLHIDTKLPDNFVELINQSLDECFWGFFKIKLDTNKLIMKVIQFFMNIRSKTTNIATGDQAIFAKKNILIEHCDEIDQHPLMEDIYISKNLKRNHGKAKIINSEVITSARYWEKHGVVKTIIKMWCFRLLYYFGLSPKKLYELYYK